MERALEKALRDWNDIREKCKGILLDSTINGRSFQMESLIELDVLLSRYGKGVDSSDFILRMARKQRKDLSAGLKLSFVEKLQVFSQAIYFAFVRQRKEVREQKYSNRRINEQLERKGFSGLVQNRPSDNIKSLKESAAYSKQISSYERVDYMVHMTSSSEGMQMTRIDAVLVNAEDKTRIRSSFDLAEFPGMDAERAGYLLQGKSVKDPGGSGDWLKLDFTDKDSKGNYRVMRMEGFETDYSIRKAVEELPLKVDWKNVATPEDIFNSLGKSGYATAKLENGAISMGVSIQASADSGNLIVKNTHGQQINPRTLKPLQKIGGTETISKRNKARVRTGKRVA